MIRRGNARRDRFGLSGVLLIAAVGALVAGAGCSRRNTAAPAETERPRLLDTFPAELGLDRRWTGDLDGMVERGVVRVLVTYSRTFYFLDGARQRGLTYEALQQFEAFLNRKLGRRRVPVRILILPVRRDRLLPALVEGLGDIAAANLTVTPERLELVDFARPFATGVSEVVVTRKDHAPITSPDDLSGEIVGVRPSSSYRASLQALNGRLEKAGREPVKVVAMDEFLEDEDILEIVASGVLPATIVDLPKASFWVEVIPDLEVHRKAAVRTGGSIAWAIRKGSPKLEAMIDSFVRSHRQGTLTGNVLLKRYLQENRWARNPNASEDRRRFVELLPLMEKYGHRYGFDPLLLMALAYQESGLDQNRRSRAGAVGVMQLRPSTAADPNVGIPDISTVENNIHAGVKYLAFLRDRYFSDPSLSPVDRALFTFAAYNAGPARVARLRSEAASSGFDPDVWFGNVEVIAARRIGRETVNYVANIARYYVVFRMIADEARGRHGPGDPLDPEPAVPPGRLAGKSPQ